MRDIKDLCARIEDELSKIADNGLTTGNLEMTYKLIDMYITNSRGYRSYQKH